MEWDQNRNKMKENKFLNEPNVCSGICSPHKKNINKLFVAMPICNRKYEYIVDP